ncbi:CPBP family intramembrane glutamic endopeptidase [Anatilimnocola floriformis]|uniref:CPBP family intramembrane glutamic endopeptidase n=1 Tax=Anatilimnocola floriformis TaxID=2948575 RepID=UPI0020C505EC|nr:CPBP family intramembrane glutamic endopeptidase [Anatilimnocola floriformis]
MLDPQPTAARYRAIALLFAMIYPTCLTWIYFTALKDSPGSWQQTAFSIGKLIQFGFPAFWIFVIERRQFSGHSFTTSGLGLALALGVFEIVAGLGLYFVVLKPAGIFAGPLQEMLLKLRGFGLDSFGAYIALGVGYSLVHSWMEEYYWRWFVFRELADKNFDNAKLPVRALVISSLAFAAHHVVVLAGYFEWSSPWTYILSAIVAIGGGLFAWIYWSSRSLYAAWLAHAFADAAIFLIGYDLVKASLH